MGMLRLFAAASLILPVLLTGQPVDGTNFMVPSPTGRVVIYSRPERAVVFIDNRYVGRTPVTNEVRRGQHRVQVYKDGYRGAEEDFNNSLLPDLMLSYRLPPLPSDLIVKLVRSADFTNALLEEPNLGLKLSKSNFIRLGPGEFQVRLLTGSYKLELGAAEKLPFKTNVYIGPGDRVELTLPLIDAIKKWKQVATFGKRGNGSGELSYPQGIAAFQNRLVIADGGNARLSVWSTNGEFVRNVFFVGELAFSFPFGIAANPNPVVSDSRKNRLVFLKSDFTFDTASSPTDPYRVPLGIDARSGVIALADSESNGIRLVKGEQSADHLDRLGLLSPIDVKWTPGGDLMISDWGNKRLVQASSSGTVLKQTPLPYVPGMLTVDPKGTIFVCSTEDNRIQIYSNDFKLAQTVLLTNASAPRGILFFQDRLYVTTQNSHKVLILEESYGD